MKITKWITFSILTGVVFGFSNRTYGQNNSITSRFYFPGGIGWSFPYGNPTLDLEKGFMLTTAFEYRPADSNSVFIRFNYDAVNNHYRQVYLNSPTNVNTGKLSSSFFSLGVGYRQQAGIFRVFGLIQPGVGINSYDKVNYLNSTDISVGQISRKHFSIKISAGLEYYLAEHFALTLEPSYFYLSPLRSYRLLNPQSLNVSIGFTTTLF